MSESSGLAGAFGYLINVKSMFPSLNLILCPGNYNTPCTGCLLSPGRKSIIVVGCSPNSHGSLFLIDAHCSLCDIWRGPDVIFDVALLKSIYQISLMGVFSLLSDACFFLSSSLVWKLNNQSIKLWNVSVHL